MKLLIVDDSKFARATITKLFTNIDPQIKIICAEDGREGFEKYRNNKPDYVIIDLLMPVINGQQLIKLIKEENAEAKIFVVSADVQQIVRDEISALGVLKFINKPLNEEKIRYIYDIVQGEAYGKL